MTHTNQYRKRALNINYSRFGNDLLVSVALFMLFCDPPSAFSVIPGAG